jgi:hypothetical protein
VDNLADFFIKVLEASNGLEISSKYPVQVLEICKEQQVENFELVQILDSLIELNTRFMRHSKKNKNLLRAWLIKICSRADILVVKDLLDRVKNLEDRVKNGQGASPRVATPSPSKVQVKEIIPVKTIAERPAPVPASNKTSSSYEAFMDHLSPGTRGMCMSSQVCFVQVISGSAKMQMPVKFKFLKSKLEARSEEICSAITKACGSEVRFLDIEILDEASKCSSENIDTVSAPCVTRGDTKLDEVITAGLNIFGGKAI